MRRCSWRRTSSRRVWRCGGSWDRRVLCCSWRCEIVVVVVVDQLLGGGEVELMNDGVGVSLQLRLGGGDVDVLHCGVGA